MAAMTKRVNIKTTVAIRSITPPICGTYKDIVMTTGDILKCLCKRAIVEEILPDGSTIRLNMKNYYTDNGAGLEAKKIKVEKPVYTGGIVGSVNNKDSVNISNAYNSGHIVDTKPDTEVDAQPAILEVAEDQPVATIEDNSQPAVLEVAEEQPTVEDVIETATEEAPAVTEYANKKKNKH